MKKQIAILAAALLVGGGGIYNMQSVRSHDYEGQPKRIVVTQAPISAEFQDSLKRKMAECGVALAFFPMTDADSQLQIRNIGAETKTIPAPHYKTYTSMIRYEITLLDLASGKNVWKAMGDFHLDEPKQNAADDHAADLHQGDRWSDELIGQMRADRLIGKCNSSVAIEPPKPAPPDPSAPPKQQSMKIGDTTYNSVEEAESGLRSVATDEVAKLTPQAGPVRGGLLMVLPTEKPAQITPIKIPGQTGPTQTSDQLTQMLAYVTVMNRVAKEMAVDGLRRDNLFSDVQLVQADDVAADDFRGQPYKFYFVPGTPAKWTLAKQAGGAKMVSPGLPSMAAQDSLPKWLSSMKGALDALGD